MEALKKWQEIKMSDSILGSSLLFFLCDHFWEERWQWFTYHTWCYWIHWFYVLTEQVFLDLFWWLCLQKNLLNQAVISGWVEVNSLFRRRFLWKLTSLLLAISLGCFRIRHPVFKWHSIKFISFKIFLILNKINFTSLSLHVLQSLLDDCLENSSSFLLFLNYFGFRNSIV